MEWLGLENNHPMEKYKEKVQPVIQSKVDELHLLGYDRVTENEVWECMIKKVWKKQHEEKKLYEVVNDILTLSANDYMNYLSMQALTATDFFKDKE